MKLTSISITLALLLFSGCNNSTQEESTNTTNTTTQTMTQNSNKELSLNLQSYARSANSFDEFSQDAIELIRNNVLEENLFELSRNAEVNLDVVSAENLLNNPKIKAYLQDFYTKANDTKRAADTTIDANFFSDLIQSIKDAITQILTTGLGLFTSDNNASDEAKVNPQIPTQFQAVWNEVISDEVTVLPQEEISFFKLFTVFKNIIFEDANRTLNEYSDIRYRFDKLAHPNGVCMKGIWKIDADSPYSGYFKKDSEALIIARASSAMSNTKKGETRAFGMAGKLFATTDPLAITPQNSANFFVIDDLGGTKAEYFTDVALTNEPTVSTNSEVAKYALYAIKVAKAFSDADSNSGIRQVYEISHLGEEDNSTVITPKWLKIEAKENQTKTSAEDFREEFILSEGETLIFNISVASSEVDAKKVWKQIGTITFDASIVSDTCDHRLHFHHPKFKDDLIYE